MRSEEAQRLLVGIHDATRGLSDPALVMREIVTRIGMHFNVTRCAYGEVDADQTALLVARGYTKDVPTVAGRYPLDAFGPLLAGELRAGRTVVIDDVRNDPLTDTPRRQQTYAAMGIVAMVVVPLLRDGRLMAILVMAGDAPRRWSQDDARLLEQVAERTLFAVESARAAAALRETSRRAAAGDEHRPHGRVDARPGARHGLVEPGVRRAVRHVAATTPTTIARGCSARSDPRIASGCRPSSRPH